LKAELLFCQRMDYDDGWIVEMVLWRVPSPVPPSKHGVKYSLLNAARAIIGIFGVPRQPMPSALSSN
jgi:hypothetical protein